MYMKNYCSRNWKYDPPDSRRPTSNWTLDTDKERMLGKLQACSFYLINLFCEFQTPYAHFSSPYIKGQFVMRGKTVLITCHLLRSPASLIKRP